MTRRFGLAIVGAGMAAAPHALALKSLEDSVRAIGIHSRSRERRAEFAGRFGLRSIERLETLLDDDEVDAVIVATPPDQRQELVRQIAEAGKHVLCEKPLERTVASAMEIVRTCRDNRVSLGVVFQHRYRAASQALIAMLDAGRLGETRMARVEVPWWRDQEYYDEPGRGTLARDGGGVLISQAIHTLDLLLRLAGPVREVQAFAATTGFHHMETEDFAVAGLRFDSGAVASVMATTSAWPGTAESITLDCEHGTAILKSGILDVQWRNGETESHGDKAETGSGSDPMAFPFDWHRDLISAFVDRVQVGEEPEVSGEDGLAVQRLVEAMIQSSREGRRVAMGGSAAAERS